MKKFHELSEREVLALAISLEEEDERVYADFAEGLRQDYPASAAMFEGMREEESGHRRRLIELFKQKFGEHIPLIRRQDVRGFVARPALWLISEAEGWGARYSVPPCAPPLDLVAVSARREEITTPPHSP